MTVRTARRALLLINPGSRSGGARRDDAQAALAAAGFLVAAPVDDDPARYAQAIAERRDHLDLVVVGGGDGSIGLALPGVLAAGLPLGVLPLGTANNFARNIGLPLTIPGAVDAIAAGATRAVDVAAVNGHLFLNVSGLGLSTEVNRRLPKELKRRWGALSYAFYALKTARRLRPFRAELLCDGARVEASTMQVTVCNGRFYGPGLSIAPDARNDDGRLDLCSTEVAHWMRALKHLPAIARGTYGRTHELRWLRGRRLEVRTRQPMRVDADGEIVTRTPAVYELLPGALRVFAPPVES